MTFRPHHGLFLFLTLGLAACQPLSPPSEAELIAQARSMPTEKDIQARFDAVRDMYRNICTAREYEAYFAKTPCLPQLSTRRQLSDASRITPEEARAMQGVLREVRDLNEATQELMRKSGIDSYIARADWARDTLDPAVLDNQKALLARRITWGEYNRKRRELMDLNFQEPASQVVEGTLLPLE